MSVCFYSSNISHNLLSFFFLSSFSFIFALRADLQADEEHSIALHIQMEKANNVNAFVTLREKVEKIPLPERVTAPE